MIDGGEFLQSIRQQTPRIALLFDRIIDGVNNMAAHLGVDPTAKIDPPDPISSIQVQPGPDMAHVTLTDNSTVRKNVQYFVEHSVDGGATWHVNHLGSSRGVNLALPTMNESGSTYNYQFRAYSQYYGSDAQSAKIVHGGTYTPTNVQLSGAAKMTLLSSTGSGTASPNGEQGGQGLGQDLQRPPQTTKRPNLNTP